MWTRISSRRWWFDPLLILGLSWSLRAEDKSLDPYLPDDTTVVKHEFYDLSYDTSNQNPRWTIYRLESSNLVDREKRGSRSFVPDPDVPGSPTRLRFKGYDAGHMVPADDMEFDPVAIKETFYTTNACPQTARLNRGNWKRLENECRGLAKKGKRLIVISGPVSPGEAAPSVYFKVVYDLDGDSPRCWLSSEKGNERTTLEDIKQKTGVHLKCPTLSPPSSNNTATAP